MYNTIIQVYHEYMHKMYNVYTLIYPHVHIHVIDTYVHIYINIYIYKSHVQYIHICRDVHMYMS